MRTISVPRVRRERCEGDREKDQRDGGPRRSRRPNRGAMTPTPSRADGVSSRRSHPLRASGECKPRARLLSSSRQDDVRGPRRCDDPPRSADARPRANSKAMVVRAPACPGLHGRARIIVAGRARLDTRSLSWAQRRDPVRVDGSRVTTRSLTLDAPSSPGRAGRSVPIGIAPPPAPSFDFVSRQGPGAGSAGRKHPEDGPREPPPRSGARPARDPRGSGRLREDDPPRPVGEPRPAAVRLGVDRRARQRPDGVSHPPRRSARHAPSGRLERGGRPPVTGSVDLDRGGPATGGDAGRDERADRAGARQRRHSAAWGLGRGRRDAHRASDGGIGGRPGRARPAAPADRRSPGRRTAARGRPRDARAQPARGAAPAARDRDRADATRMSPSS